MRSYILAVTAVAVALAGCSAESGSGMPNVRGSNKGSKSPTTGSGTNNGSGSADNTGTDTPSDGTPGTDTPSTPAASVGTETWADGKQLTGSVTIGKGATVTIAPGAKITVAKGASITVLGTLTAKSAQAHAKLTGTAWLGVVVGSGGSLALDGVDIENAATGIETLEGATAATLEHGAITLSTTPFKVGKGTSFTIKNSKVVATGQSAVNGTLLASYLDYDKQTNEGIVSGDATAKMTIEDSTLHGAGGGDFVVSQKGATVKVAYTTIGGAHCGFHFDSVGAFEIDHVTVDTNTYGAMLYGSGAGPNKITASNFANTSVDLDAQGANGPITIDGSYTSGKDSFVGVKPTITAAQTQKIANAKPR